MCIQKRARVQSHRQQDKRLPFNLRETGGTWHLRVLSGGFVYGPLHVMIPLRNVPESCTIRLELIDSSEPAQELSVVTTVSDGLNHLSFDVPHGTYRRLNVYMQAGKGPLLCVL